MALTVIHRHLNKFKTLCGMHHMFSTNSISGLRATTNKTEVTCKRCLNIMHKWEQRSN